MTEKTSKIAARLQELSLEIPHTAAPVANYVPYVISGNQVFVSGQLPMRDGKVQFVGRVGEEFSLEQAQEAARLAALNVIAQVKAACGGDLDRVVRCVKLGGFVNSTGSFVDQSKVVNGASDLMVQVFGDAGRHARLAVSVPSLPLGAAVEIDAVFEVRV